MTDTKDDPAAPNASPGAVPGLEDMQQWTLVMGRAQQMLMEYWADQMKAGQNVPPLGPNWSPPAFGLAEEAVTGTDIRLLARDLTAPGWADEIGPAPWDAAVSSTALHWLAPDELTVLYRTLGGRLRPGGIFVDADNRISGTGHDAAEAPPGLLRGDRVHRHTGSYDDQPPRHHPELDHDALTDARSADPVLVW